MLQLRWSLPLGLLMAGLGMGPGITSRGAEGTGPVETPKPPLSERVDQLIEAAAIGPLAPRCRDHEFLRRLSLDLTGVIPTVAQLREFLADTSPDKRHRVIDELLDSPEFSRHLAVQLDVTLLERQSDAHVSVQEWEGYLIQSIAEAKPLDQLYAELVAADRLAPEARAATKFLLNRESEPNAVTREIGRLAFGMDLQCAQCHDHPLIDDYEQEDYYGLFAFVHRTSLVVDAESKQAGLSETAEGEASFTSVFTGNSQERALPRIPHGRRLFDEPSFAEEEAYATKPENGVAGVPKHSRREALAAQLRDSRPFRRNVANRLWAHLFGRGLVHPVDFHHGANPPANPELLELLADELADGGFDLREMLRQLARTRAYQRVCDAPPPETINFADVAARSEQLARAAESAAAALAPLEKAAAEATAAVRESLAQSRELDSRLPELEEALTAAQGTADEAQAAEQVAQESLAAVEDQARSVAAAVAQNGEAVAKLPDDEALAAAAAVFTAKAEELAIALEAARTAAGQAKEQVETTAAAVEQAETALAEARAARVAPDALAKLEQAELAARHRRDTARDARHVLQSQRALCESMAQYAVLAKSDPEAAAAVWQSLVERWSIAGQIAPLRPLTPEQLAASAMRATGMLAPRIAAAEAKLQESPPEELASASEEERPQLEQRRLQQELLEQLRGTVREFVSHYGGLPGEDFQATVNQALFFGNSPLVQSWLNPAGENLANRLAGMEEPGALADELYLSVLSRPPRPSERQEVTALLNDADAERRETIAQLLWALLSSTEFRFNH